ncbi:putative holin-like toxin [Alicyclobacillus sp. ALC3]|nr:putative holin-like toxin [Alicyclobacillus sp. ALC3]
MSVSSALSLMIEFAAFVVALLSHCSRGYSCHKTQVNRPQ